MLSFTCFLLETKITKDFANSSLAVLRTWSQSFQTFSSQKQAAYEHSAAGGTKFMMSRSRDDRIFPSSEPVEDWWVSLAAELLEATEAGPPPVDALADEGLFTLLGELLGFSAIEVIVFVSKVKSYLESILNFDSIRASRFASLIRPGKYTHKCFTLIEQR
mgnify:CR=1 FL=1